MTLWNRKQFQERMEKEQIYCRIWGKHGKAIADELEQKLEFALGADVRLFVEEIGNLQLAGGYDILIAGSESPDYDCITESEYLIKEHKLTDGINIMDFAGMSYILHKDHSIKAYDSHYDIEPEGVVFAYASLTDLIQEIIKDIEENPYRENLSK